MYRSRKSGANFGRTCKGLRRRQLGSLSAPALGGLKEGCRTLGNSANAQFSLWLERVARGLVDFMAVQAAGVAALTFVGAAPWLGRAGQTPLSEGVLTHYYFHTFLPVSLVFPLMHSLLGLYTKLRGYTLDHKLRRAGISASAATLLLVFVCFLLNRSQLPRSAALLFGVLAVGAAVGVRWVKDWLFHRELQSSGSVQTAEIVRSSEKTVLVVGGAGYIGSVLLGKLLERGHKVRLLDNLVYGDLPIKPLLENPRLEFVEGDCRNIQDAVRAMTGVRDVIHLAAIVGDPACAQDNENALQINYAATRMMAEIAQGQGVERFVFASSCSVYGASDSLMDENSATEPISLYAETKVNSEQVLLDSRSKSFHPIILRFATVFGLAPRPRFDLVVNLLTAKALQDGVITIFNGGQWRPFIHVEDVAEGIVQVFQAPLESVNAEIFNVGDDSLNFTLSQVAEKIRLQIPGTRIEHVHNSDLRNYRVSFRKIRDCVGFTAKHSLEDGIVEIQRAYELGLIENYRQPFYSNSAFLKERGQVAPKGDLDVKVMAAFASAGSASQGRSYSWEEFTTLPLGSGQQRSSATP